MDVPRSGAGGKAGQSTNSRTYGIPMDQHIHEITKQRNAQDYISHLVRGCEMMSGNRKRYRTNGVRAHHDASFAFCSSMFPFLKKVRFTQLEAILKTNIKTMLPKPSKPTSAFGSSICFLSACCHSFTVRATELSQNPYQHATLKSLKVPAFIPLKVNLTSVSHTSHCGPCLKHIPSVHASKIAVPSDVQPVDWIQTDTTIKARHRVHIVHKQKHSEIECNQ